MAKAPPLPMRATLRDDTPVLLKAIGPADRAGLAAGFARLSDRSRRQRFLAPLRRLTQGQLRYLTELDYDDHMAWGAVDLSVRPFRGAGVARYVRLDDDPASAEVAVTVIDAYQGRGLGTLLLTLLARTATANGIESFCGTVADDNRPMLGLLGQAGAAIAQLADQTSAVTVPLPRELPLPAWADA